jgi:hypothetical protein
MHIKYKVFSLGFLHTSIFDYSRNDAQTYEDHVKAQCNLYKQIALGQSDGSLSKIVCEDVQTKQCALAWLEHRRWSAFTRMLGYRHTGEIKRNLQLNGSNHKNMELKLHPCLVEAEMPTLSGNNRYLHEEWKDVFAHLSAEFKIEELKKEDMLSLLKRKKEHLEAKRPLLEKYRSVKSDLLDTLSLAWCAEATEASLAIIETALQVLGRLPSAAPSKADRELFKKAWQGVYFYDFKTYDYCKFDYKEE